MSYIKKIEHFFETHRAHEILAILITINAITLGLETSSYMTQQYGEWLVAIDHTILGVFVLELMIRFLAFGKRFFACGWNWFDSIIIILSLLPIFPGLSVLRSLRILRLMRLMSLFPRFRIVVAAIMSAIPGILSVAIILVGLFYVSAVMACKLFGADHAFFKTLPQAMYTLFQLMLADDWGNVTRAVLVTHPYAYLFFIPFMIVMTFSVLNLFFGLIVNAMQNAAEKENNSSFDKNQIPDTEITLDDLMAEIKTLRAEVNALAAHAANKNPSAP